MKIFYSEIDKFDISYKSLIDNINETKFYKFVANHNDYFLIFKDIFLSMVNDSEIMLVDSDLSENEISKMKIGDVEKIIECNFKPIVDENDLLDRIINTKNWKIILLSSGTTGVPKKIEHNFFTLTRGVKISEERKQDVWGFAYNPTHIAGVQVFFQALLNLNSIVRLFLLSNEQIYKSIAQYKITNISATPSFFRLIKNNNLKFETVQRITSGGEKFDAKLSEQLLNMFPNAKILNIYASTEFGTLFAARGEYFVVENKMQEYIKIVNSELWINESFLGKSSQLKVENGWYKTGDKVEVLSEKPLTFKFLGRINEAINIGGYKVYPAEVEEVINSYPKVKRSKVYAKKNSVLGNILVCDIELNDLNCSEKEIYDYLKERLQAYKVVRIINFVNQIETTRTGKLERK